MDFEIKDNPEIQKQKDNYNRVEIDLAYKFSNLMIKEFQHFIKSIVLFGSTARKNNIKGDIDILVIIDDVSVQFNKAIIQGYRILTQNIIQKVSPKLHITTMRLSNYWDYARSGDPVAVNILREGIGIIDSGIFNPMKLLLYQGRIKPSDEAISNYSQRAKLSIDSSKQHILAGCMDLYWSVIDAAQALLMKVNEIPPKPGKAYYLLEKRFVQTGLLNKRYSIILQEFYHLNKAIEHKEITYISGEQYSKYLHQAQDFVEELTRLLEKK